jgi:general secretion pathway protein K
MRQRGFALLIVLWTLALLALLGTQLVAAGRGEAQLARNLVDAAQTEAATDGAVQQAIFAMLDASDARWKTDGMVHEIRLGDVAVSLRLADENGKVNPNLASASLLAALLVQVGAPPSTAASLANAIVDWRTDNRLLGQPDADAARYGLAGLDYAPPGANFLDVDELGEVLGMTAELLARLRPHMTVYSARDPDGATADGVVAAALRQAGPAAQTDNGEVPVAEIVARASGPNHCEFAERVVVRVDAADPSRPFEMLQRERLAQ